MIPVSKSFGDAKMDVLARIGQTEDGTSNPLLVNDAGVAINAALAQLPATSPWLQPKNLLTTTIVSGQKLVGMPVDAMGGGIIGLRMQVDSYNWQPLAYGINPSAADLSGIPTNFDMLATQGIRSVTVGGGGGSGYSSSTVITPSGGNRDGAGDDAEFGATVIGGVLAAVTPRNMGAGWSAVPTLAASIGSGATLTPVLGQAIAIRLWPVPSITGVLEITYKPGAVTLANDGDLLPFDPEAVISCAAALLAVSKAPSMAPMLGDIHKGYLAGLRRNTSPARTAGLAQWRQGT